MDARWVFYLPRSLERASASSCCYYYWEIWKDSRTFRRQEMLALDLVQKIKDEEARIWGLAGAKFLTVLIVGA
jgi:hypothetical protein